MKQLNLLLASVLLLLISGICLYIVLWYPFGMQQFIGISIALFNNLWGKVFIVATGFVCLGCGLSLLALFMGLDPSDRPHILLDQEGGVVGVSLDAVEDYVKRKGQMVEGVRDIAVQAQMSDDGITLLARVTLELQRNIPEFIQAFQNKLQHELIETIGLKKVKEIQILIHKIVPKEGSEGRLLGSPSPVLLKESETAGCILRNDDRNQGVPRQETIAKQDSEQMELKNQEEKP